MYYCYRLAVQQDLPAIVDIYNSTVVSREVTADTEPVSVASRQTWFDQHNPERRPLWVVEAAITANCATQQIVGWLSYSDFYGRPAYNGTAELSVYIHEAMRGQGLGRYLLSEAMKHAPAIGVHTLLGFVFAHNQPSLKLFEGFGFERWGHFPGVAKLDETERDLVILGKRVA